LYKRWRIPMQRDPERAEVPQCHVAVIQLA
jgi:hypothetical protein